MFEPVYSSQGGSPLGYRCRVLVEKGTVAQRFCGKLCKSYIGMQRHALAKHGMKIQMEMFSDVQEKANRMYAEAQMDAPQSWQPFLPNSPPALPTMPKGYWSKERKKQMPKQRPQNNLSLFETAEPNVPPATTALSTSSPPPAEPIDATACPKCGGRSQETAHPRDHEGKTRYCIICVVDGEPYYFTPEIKETKNEPTVCGTNGEGLGETSPVVEVAKESALSVVYEEAKIPDRDVLMLGCSATEIPLANSSVQCIVTSPPYWALRKYAGEQDVEWKDGMKCPYGLEPNVNAYIEHSIQVLRELRRVLRCDGVLFWNLGDSYAGSATIGSGGGSKKQQSVRGAHFENDLRREFGGGIKPKDLCLIPQRIALTAQADGWWIRSMIIWAKPNPMPESCTDRPTDAYEQIIMMTKNKQYFWDGFAVAEPSAGSSKSRYELRDSRNFAVEDKKKFKRGEGQVASRGDNTDGLCVGDGDNRAMRNVWTFATQPYSGAHFATFPEELPRRCILAATSEKGCCTRCGAPYERMLEDTPEYKALKESNRANPKGAFYAGTLEGGKTFTNDSPGYTRDQITTGWTKTCRCPGDEIKPCVVLDPFGGSGTTGRVAIELNRRAVLVDITYKDEKGYAPLVEKRLDGVQRTLIYG